MVKKVKIAVLISGKGSNLKALIEACLDTNFPAEISLVISNKEDAYGLEIAKNNNIKNFFIDHRNFSNRKDFDQKMSEKISENNCQIICLAGFMRLLSAEFIDNWQHKIINIHPSLLPAFKGANAIADALNYGVKYTGCSTHFVTQEMDSGPIIDQEVVEIKENDDFASLKEKIHQKEHILYKRSLHKVVENIF